MTAPAAPDAIVLAGGRASRLGGIDKPRMSVGGSRLIDDVVAASAEAGCGTIVVAGPDGADGVLPPVTRVREDPPFGGPVAGIAAALPHVTTERVLLLAGDLADPYGVLELLLGARTPAGPASGLCLADQDGREQWLAGAYPTRGLRDGAAALPDGGRGASLRQLLRGIRITAIPAPASVVRDVDTWEDVDIAGRERAARRE